MKTKIIVDFNGSRQGIKVSVKCDPEKEIYVVMFNGK